jgi:dipeptidase D
MANGVVEPSFLVTKRPDITAISVGPNMADVHNPNEHISIKSTERVYNTIVKLLSYK